MPKFIAWMVAFMELHSAPGRKTYIPEAQETKEAADIRYLSIAHDIAKVVSEEDPLFKGPQGRIKTATVILSIMRHESDFRRDVDLGKGGSAKGDSGNSVCMMQINIGQGRTMLWNTKEKRQGLPADPKSDVVEGWKMADLLADRTNCIRAGYRIMKISFRSGSGLPPTEWLRVYASGDIDKGIPESRARMGLALRYFADHTPDFNDEDFMPKVERTDLIVSNDFGMMSSAPSWAKNAFVRPIYAPGNF